MNNSNGLIELIDEIGKELQLTEGQQARLVWILHDYFVNMTNPQLSDSSSNKTDIVALDIREQLVRGIVT